MGSISASAFEQDPLSTLLPYATVEERQLRKRLNNARTIASARAVTTRCEPARSIFWIVNEVASGWTFAPASLEDLKDTADNLVRLFMVASNFERLEGGGE